MDNESTVKDHVCEDVMKYFCELKNKGSLSRFGKCFNCGDFYYFYDTGTGKVLECSKTEYDVLINLTENNTIDFANSSIDVENNKWQCALTDIWNAVKEEHIFSAKEFIKFDGGHFGKIEQMIAQNIQQVIFEVTESCNLRCKYCIYQDNNGGFRNFGKKYLEIEKAYKVLDYIFANSYGDELYIGFYGGEPLLNVDFIRCCVEYSKKNCGKKKLSYSLTTNGTLITRELAEYFASIPDFNVMVSIDGDKQTHNENRVFVDGKGTFDDAINGLKLLLDAYGDERRNQISISAVVSPPYDNEKFERMQGFYEHYAKGIQSNITYVEMPYEGVSQEKKSEMIEDRMPMLAWDKKRNLAEQKNAFTYGAKTAELLKIHKRTISQEPNVWHKLNGCCIPGMRRLYVTSEGKFLPCERVGNAPYIGDVENGLDYEAIKKYYVDEYASKSLSDCSSCWAAPLCGICYSHCCVENGIDIERKREVCDDERFSILQNLIYYHELLKDNPEYIDSLNDMSIV